MLESTIDNPEIIQVKHMDYQLTGRYIAQALNNPRQGIMNTSLDRMGSSKVLSFLEYQHKRKILAQVLLQRSEAIRNRECISAIANCGI